MGDGDALPFSFSHRLNMLSRMNEHTPDLLCLGEPMVEFNDQSNGMFLYGFGGDVSNVAVAAARQGTRVGMATRIGADSFGDDLVALWRSEGIDIASVERDPTAPTGIYFVRHGPDGHRFEYRRAGSATSLLAPDTLPLAAIRSARCLHLSGISQAISASARDACDAAVRAAKDADTLISFDPNLRLSLWDLDEAKPAIHRIAAQADIFLPGIDDARVLTGIDDPEQIVAFYRDLGAQVVALTLGEQGALVASGDGVISVPAPKVEAKDASGAGDCFDGAFLARHLDGDSLRDAATYAVTAAALAVQGYGAIAPIPSAAAVLNEMSKTDMR